MPLWPLKHVSPDEGAFDRVARAVAYRRRGFKPQTLLTSLHDAEKYPAKELAAL
jgi:hypothetical protein